MLYRDIPSLREYLLIDSTGSIHIEKYAKIDDIWQLSEFKSLADTVHIKALKIDVAMDDIYEGVYG